MNKNDKIRNIKINLVSMLNDVVSQKGLTHLEAATLCDMDQSNFTKILKGRRATSVDKLLHCVLALNPNVAIDININGMKYTIMQCICKRPKEETK